VILRCWRSTFRREAHGPDLQGFPEIAQIGDPACGPIGLTATPCAPATLNKSLLFEPVQRGPNRRSTSSNSWANPPVDELVFSGNPIWPQEFVVSIVSNYKNPDCQGGSVSCLFE